MRVIENNKLKKGMLVTDIIPGGILTPVYLTVAKISRKHSKVFMKYTDHPLGATLENGGYCSDKNGLIPFSSIMEWYLVEEEDENN
jgi:hypothetical protein